MGLSNKPDARAQRMSRFCDEYLLDFNGTQAAIRSGYSQKTAGQIAYELLRRPEIKLRIEEMKVKQQERTQMSAQRVLDELAKIATSNPANYLVPDGRGGVSPDLSRMGRDDWAAISGLEFDTVIEKVKGSGRGGKAKPGAALTRSAVSKIRHWDKKAALELLGRHYSLWGTDAAPPPPANPERRATIINVLVRNLDAKAQAVHVEVQEGDGRPPLAALNGHAKPNGKGNGHG